MKAEIKAIKIFKLKSTFVKKKKKIHLTFSQLNFTFFRNRPAPQTDKDIRNREIIISK